MKKGKILKRIRENELSQWLTPWLVLIIVEVLIGFLIYLPKPSALGLYNDDWYLMYDAKVMGVDFFKTIFAIDRPLRAPLQSVLYYLFGESILAYQFSALSYRVLGALFFGSSVKTIFKNNTRSWMLASFLFFIYPGFLSQPNAIDYQAHLFSLMLAMASIWIFLSALKSTSKGKSIALAFVSLLLTYGYLGLMEYFLGIEVLKLALGIYLVSDDSIDPLFEKVRERALIFAIWLLGGTGFLFWRVFLFESQRKATDITGKLDVFSVNFLGSSVSWALGVLVNTLHALVGAWVVPFYQAALKVDGKALLIDLTIFALLAVLVGWFVHKHGSDERSERNTLLWVGLLGVAAAIFPVIFAGRSIDFGDYSRYTLPVIASSTLILTILVCRIENRLWRVVVIAMLAFSAVVTHRQNFQSFAERTESERSFWNQVSWRVPHLQEGTTLVISYPNAAIQEDYFVWGPANFIYSDQTPDGEDLIVPINALVLDKENLNLILAGRGQVEHYRRGNQTNTDLGDVLVISQATSSSCARVMDAGLVEYSEFEETAIRVAATVSKSSLILVDGKHDHLPTTIFGIQPEQGWCYYFEKADLARQQGYWREVVKLGEQALALGYYPGDRSEWLPFVQANVMLGNASEIKQIGKRFTENKLLKRMACENFLPIAPDEASKAMVDEVFCK